MIAPAVDLEEVAKESEDFFYILRWLNKGLEVSVSDLSQGFKQISFRVTVDLIGRSLVFLL